MFIFSQEGDREQLVELFEDKWLSCSVDGTVVLSERIGTASNPLQIDGVPVAPWADGDTVACYVLASEPGSPPATTTSVPPPATTTTAAPPTTTTTTTTTVPPATTTTAPPGEQVTAEELRAQAAEKLSQAGELETRAADLEAQAAELLDDAADRRALAARRIASAEKKEAKAQQRPAQADRLLSQAAQLRERARKLDDQAAGLEASAGRRTQQADDLRSTADVLRAEAAELNAAADELDAPPTPMWSTTMTVGSWLYQGKVNRLGFQAGASLDYGSLSSTAVVDGDETYRVGVLSWFTFGPGSLYVVGESAHEEDLAELWDGRWLSCSVDGDVVLSAQLGSMGDHLKISDVVDDGRADAPWAEGDTVACEVLESQPASD